MASQPPARATLDAFEAALRTGRELVEQERGESAEDLAFEADLDRQKAHADLQKTHLANENERALIGLRKSYGRNMIRFLWVYFLAALAAVIATGLGYLDLPEAVLVALIGGTAVSVLGVVGTIVAGLFRVRAE